MKKLFVLATIMLSLVCSTETFAQSKKELKNVKIRAKELTKEGWKVEGVGTLESELVKIESKRGNAEILVGSAYGNKKISLAKAKARNNAINEYAEYAKSIVKGRINSGLSDLNGEETDNIVSGFERMVIRELDGEINIPALVLIRSNGATNDCQCFYVIDSDAAEKARIKAMNQAIEEAGVAHKYGNEISKFVNEGFHAE